MTLSPLWSEWSVLFQIFNDQATSVSKGTHKIPISCHHNNKSPQTCFGIWLYVLRFFLNQWGFFTCRTHMMTSLKSRKDTSTFWLIYEVIAGLSSKGKIRLALKFEHGVFRLYSYGVKLICYSKLIIDVVCFTSMWPCD